MNGVNGRSHAELAYNEVTRSHQAITDFRAKLLGLLPLASGAGILLLLRDGSGEQSGVDLAAIGLFGFVVTLGLFLYELRGIRECVQLRCQAMVLEEQLGFNPQAAPFRNRAREAYWGIVGAEGAGWIIYTAVMASWLYVAGSQIALDDEMTLWEDGRGLALAGIYLVVLAIKAYRMRADAKNGRYDCVYMLSAQRDES